LEDDLLRWRRTDDFRKPSERRGAPRGLARLAHVLSQEKGVEAIRRGVEVTATIFTGATQSANGVVIDLGDGDGGEVARTQQPGQWAGIAAVGLDPGPSFFRNERGRHPPTVMPRLRQIAVQPLAGRPASWANTRWLACECSCRSSVSRSRADRPQGDDLRALIWGHVGHRDGLLMDLQADIKQVRLGHG